jgi:hypothetical protein
MNKTTETTYVIPEFNNEEYDGVRVVQHSENDSIRVYADGIDLDFDGVTELISVLLQAKKELNNE